MGIRCLGLGYRDIKHIKAYVEKGGDIDEASIQKIIPRIRTVDERFKDDVVPNLITKLEQFGDNTKNFRKKLEELKKRFESQGFV